MKKITKLGMAAAVLFCVVGLGSHTQAAMAAEETTIAVSYTHLTLPTKRIV